MDREAPALLSAHLPLADPLRPPGPDALHLSAARGARGGVRSVGGDGHRGRIPHALLAQGVRHVPALLWQRQLADGRPAVASIGPLRAEPCVGEHAGGRRGPGGCRVREDSGCDAQERAGGGGRVCDPVRLHLLHDRLPLPLQPPARPAPLLRRPHALLDAGAYCCLLLDGAGSSDSVACVWDSTARHSSPHYPRSRRHAAGHALPQPGPVGQPVRAAVRPHAS
mmetsp:Transcript_9016/g.18004  ORF Transcript_9016/g.18004 Transcript_9016/m.18004 type:complete len:224 (-) Transcript_9016:1019-1690(-)